MAWERLRLLVCALVMASAVAACEPLEFPPPVIDRVVPAFVVKGEGDTVVVHGRNFYSAFEVSLRGDLIVPNDQFEGFITNNVGDELAPVTVTRSSRERLVVELDALDAASLPAQVDSFLSIVDAVGNSVRKPLQVLPSAPRTLKLATRDPPHRVNTDNTLSVSLLDASGQSLAVNTPVCLYDASRRPGAPAALVPITLQAPAGSSCPMLADGTPTVQADITTQSATTLFRGSEIGTAEIGGFVPGTSLVTEDNPLIVIQSGVPTSVELPRDFSYILPNLETTVSVLDDGGTTIESQVVVERLELRCLDTGTPVLLQALENQPLAGATTLNWFVTRPCRNAELYASLGEVLSWGTIKVGARTSLDVLVDAERYPEIRAGEPFVVRVVGLDDFGNRAIRGSTLHTLVNLEASSLTPEGGPALIQTDESCSNAIDEHSVDCLVSTTVASPSETLSASILDLTPPVVGALGGLLVRPGRELGSIEVTAPLTFFAGIAGTVWVQAYDVYGNVMDTEDVPDVTLRETLAPDDPVPCEATGARSADGLEYQCTLTTARTTASLTASAAALTGVSAPFVVHNGPLAEVVFDTPATVVAGEEVDVGIAAFDKHWNPYVVPANDTVSLTDDSGTWSVSSVTLDATGSAIARGTFTRKGGTHVLAGQEHESRWFSDLIDVEAAATSALRPVVQAPWAIVDQSEVVETEATDDYGNRTDWSGTVTLQSRTTASTSVGVSVVNGVGRARFTWSQVGGLTDVLDAISTQWTGETDPVVVVEACDTGMPTAAALVDGHDVGVACLDPKTDTSVVSVDMSSSTAGSASLLGYAVSVDGARATASTTSLVDVTLAKGGHTLDLFAIDASGCADIVQTDAWVGPDDGTPVGPLLVSALEDDVDVDLDSLSLSVAGVHDCNRVVASGEVVRVRTTAGTMVGPTASGQGLELTLDAVGDASWTVETAGDLSEGTLSVHAWNAGHTAGGLLEVPLVGDDVAPVVLSQTPEGDHLGLVDEVQLVLSEPVMSASLDTDSFDLSGPSALDVDSVAVEASGTRIRVEFDGSADGAAGVWWLTGYGSDLVDAAGNGLSGDWSGATANYEGAFGDVGAGVDGLSCTSISPLGGRFRPDGDPGTGVEGDLVTGAFESDSAPSWWVVEVTDSTGRQVRYSKEVPVAATDTVSWDGRGWNGTVLANGAYTLTVTPDDGLGNQGSGCAWPVTLDNAGGTLR